MLQQLLPLPGFVPFGPANDLAPDPFEGMMPRFLELPLRMYFAECKMPRPKPVEPTVLEVVVAPEAAVSLPPAPRPRLAVPVPTSKRAREKAKRRSRLRNMHGRRH